MKIFLDFKLDDSKFEWQWYMWFGCDNYYGSVVHKRWFACNGRKLFRRKISILGKSFKLLSKNFIFIFVFNKKLSQNKKSKSRDMIE